VPPGHRMPSERTLLMLVPRLLRAIMISTSVIGRTAGSSVLPAAAGRPQEIPLESMLWSGPPGAGWV